MSTPEPWSILADVAGHLQVSEDTVLRWIAKRKLPAHRVGRIWRYKLTEVDAWLRVGGHHADGTFGTVQPRPA